MKKFLVFSISVLLTLLPGARGQNLNVSTLAGVAGQTSVDGNTTTARFNNPSGVVVDASGNVFVVDTDSHCIRKISGSTVSTFAGTIGVSGTNDATGTSARFNSPAGIAIDALGNLYVTDSGNHTIRQITSLGVVTTLAGSPTLSGTANGSGSTARFNQPEGIALFGSTLYVADTLNHTIRAVTTSGTVSTYAGTAGTPGSNNSTGTSATFNTPQGVAVDASGNVYVADTGNQLIRLIASGAVVTTFAGVNGTIGSLDAVNLSATFWDPIGIAVSGTTVYVADSFNNTIRKIASGSVTTPFGSSTGLGSADGTGTAARFWQPQGLCIDVSGNIYVAEGGNGTIRKITGTTVNTLAGLASTGSSDTPGTPAARFNSPSGACIDNSGTVYVADTQNHTIRSVTSAGVSSTPFGLPGVSGSTDGSGSNARFNAPQGICRDSSGNLYVADTGNHTIRKIVGTTVSLLAGTAGTSGVADGTGSAAQFNSPAAVAVDASSSVYVADTGNHTIRKITSGGVVTTFAGIAGIFGTSDGTGANVGTNGARFFAPEGIAVDGSGNVFVADTRNHTIRKITSGGVVSTIAGLAGSYGSTDGSSNVARFFLPQAIAVDATGVLWVLDSGNQTIRKLTNSSGVWISSTVAGNPNVAGTADGSGSGARFFNPAGLGINSSGTLAIADLGNNTIRLATTPGAGSPIINSPPASQTVVQGNNATFSVGATGNAPLAYQWYFNSVAINGANASTYTRANAQTSDAGSYSVIVTNSVSSTPSSPAVLTVIVPPNITSGPQNQTLGAGQNATFSVVATGTAPLSYQWYFGASPIAGGTSSSYVRTNVQSSDAGSYSCVVTNVAGTNTSPAATLTVTPTSPTITQQPQNQSPAQGQNVTLSVVAMGSNPLTYSWYFNNGQIGGATSSTYAINNVQPANAGSYTVIVANANGWVTSSPPAVVTVAVPPLINVQPTNQLTWVSSNVTFSVGLSQGTSPSYQWRLNGSPISGATQSSYNIPSVQWADAGSYSVIITNNGGSATSGTALLIVQQLPQTFTDGFESYNLGLLPNDFSGPNNNPANNPWWGISSGAQSSVVNSSTGVTPNGGSNMAGHTSGGSTFQQQWVNLVYRFNSGQPYYGNFLVEWWFYDPYGVVNLTSASNYQDYIAIGSYSPVSTSSDTISQSIIYSRLSLGAFNTTGFNVSNYQGRVMGTTGQFGSANSWYNTSTKRSAGWHHARIVWGIPDANKYAPLAIYIDNMTNATLIPSSDGTNTGFNVIEMNHANTSSGYYDDFTFRAANDPWIIEQPQSTTVNVGDSTTFTTVAVGTSYQWQLNGNPISGATDSAYTVASAALGNAGSYTCAIRGTNGTIATSAAVLTLNGPPNITGQPSSLTVNQGQNATFTVTATGTGGTLNYQWLFNSSPIGSATSSSYTVTNATTGKAGSYSVVVTNNAGGVTSSTATLTVIVPPTVSTQPASATVNQGQNAGFSVAANGTAPNYQWRFNGGNISGANSSSYTRTSAQAGDAGSYSVVVSNSAGSVTSTDALLTVIIPPSITTQPASETVLEGATANFSVVATGSNPSFQWRFNGVAISNAHSSSYQKANAQTSDAGSYSVVVSNNAGTVTSGNAVLSVVTGQTTLASITANADSTISMVWNVQANTNYTLQYKASLLDAQWNNLSNVTPASATLAIGDAPGADGQRTYQLANAQRISELGGFLRLPLLGNSDNFVSIPFGRAPAISALVSSISGNVITAGGSPGWTANQFVYVSGTQPNTYFVRFTSGAAAGKVYTITANTANSLTLNLGNDSLATVAANDSFAIEAYWTLGTVFPSGTGVNISPTLGNRNTELLIPDMASAGINLSASKVYFFNAGIWKQVGQGSANHNDDILTPNVYFVVRHNVATNTTLTTVGRVITTPIAATIMAQNGSQQDNYIGLQRPVPVSLDNSGLISSGAFSASPLPGSRTDELLTFDNADVARNKSSNASYYYWQNAWRQVGGGNTDVGSTLIFQPGTGVIIRKGTNNVSPVWTNSATWTQ